MTHNVKIKIAQPLPPYPGFPLVNQLTNQNILLVFLFYELSGQQLLWRLFNVATVAHS